MMPCKRAGFLFVLGTAAALYGPTIGQAQTLYISELGASRVSEYDALTGGLVNQAFLSDFDGPNGLALSGDSLYIAEGGDGRVGVYNATTGFPINANLCNNGEGSFGMTVSGNKLFITQTFPGGVGEYDATTGATINPTFGSGFDTGIGLNNPSDVVVSGNNLYVSNTDDAVVGLYDATTGLADQRPVYHGLRRPGGTRHLGQRSVRLRLQQRYRRGVQCHDGRNH